MSSKGTFNRVVRTYDQCALCNVINPFLTIDHKLPLVKGGTDEIKPTLEGSHGAGNASIPILVFTCMVIIFLYGDWFLCQLYHMAQGIVDRRFNRYYVFKALAKPCYSSGWLYFHAIFRC
jgi:hypothetical protein